jgi:ActR/RegA family two-component response regulator
MPDFAQTLGVDYAVVYAPAIGKQFAPNVTVITQPSQGMSIQQIMQSLQNDVSEMDLQVVDVQIDDVNKSGVITVSGNLWGVQIDGVQRIILHQGYAYIATAMLPIALRGDTAVTQGINQILNSFRV